MNKEYKKVLNNLPTKWDEVTLSTYLKLIEALPADETDLDKIESDYLVLSALTDIDIDELKMIFFKDLLTYVNRIQFVYTELPDVKIKYKCKDISSIGYDSFVVWMKLQDKPFENMNKLLPVFFEELKDGDINQLPITIVNRCFFLLRKKSKKHLNSLAISLNLKLIRMKMLGI